MKEDPEYEKRLWEIPRSYFEFVDSTLVESRMLKVYDKVRDYVFSHDPSELTPSMVLEYMDEAFWERDDYVIVSEDECRRMVEAGEISDFD